MNTTNTKPLDNDTLQELAGACEKVDLDGNQCYEISPFHSYWIEEGNREFKDSLTIWVGYMIAGNFDPSQFIKALSYLTERHESLRSHFMSTGDKYYITAEENGRFSEKAFAHGLMLDPGNGKDMMNWIYFKDHIFDIEKGPLFQVRIARKEEDVFLVAVKVHHSILDTWSWDILMRDLFTAYKAFEIGELPDLPPLRFQYKEWLGWRKKLIGKNYDEQKLHWRSLYNGVPGRLLIPGAKLDYSPPPCRKGKKDYFFLSGQTMERMEYLCRKYNANLFLMFRALFMLYLSKITGQNDIMIGTMVTGRTTVSSHVDQIGSYAYTDLSRIIFDREDTLREAVEKVNRSFQDMYIYNDYTLLMALSEMLPPGNPSSVPFWNINLDFADGESDNIRLSREPTFTGIRLDRLPSSNIVTLTDMDLKLKIVDMKDKIEIRVLYDPELYDSTAITHLITGFLKYIDTNTDRIG